MEGKVEKMIAAAISRQKNVIRRHRQKSSCLINIPPKDWSVASQATFRQLEFGNAKETLEQNLLITTTPEEQNYKTFLEQTALMQQRLETIKAHLTNLGYVFAKEKEEVGEIEQTLNKMQKVIGSLKLTAQNLGTLLDSNLNTTDSVFENNKRRCIEKFNECLSFLDGYAVRMDFIDRELKIKTLPSELMKLLPLPEQDSTPKSTEELLAEMQSKVDFVTYLCKQLNISSPFITHSIGLLNIHIGMLARADVLIEIGIRLFNDTFSQFFNHIQAELDRRSINSKKIESFEEMTSPIELTKNADEEK